MHVDVGICLPPVDIHLNEERKILENLYKNPDISILRQDKGRGVVIMNHCNYVDKAERKIFLVVLNSKNYQTIPQAVFRLSFRRLFDA